MFMTKTIFSNLIKRYSTRMHPVEQRILPDGFRGRFKFAIDKCILCRQCVIKCPTKVIRIDPEIGLWEREVMGCLYCGVCEDVCPTGCITMTNVYRPPITEPAFLRFNVKPRPSKKKTDVMPESEIKKAIEEKIAQEALEGKSRKGKVEALEEDAVIPVSKAEEIHKQDDIARAKLAEQAGAEGAGEAVAKTAPEIKTESAPEKSPAAPESSAASATAPKAESKNSKGKKKR